MKMIKFPEFIETRLYKEISELFQKDSSVKKSKQHIMKIECHYCGKREAFTNIDRPLNIRCNRQNNCQGAEGMPYSLYFPDLKEKYWKIYLDYAKPTPNDPDRRSKSYARYERGINNFEKFGGLYSRFTTSGREYFTTAVKLTNGHLNHRLIDHDGKDKTRNSGPTEGAMFIPDNLDFKNSDLYLTEAAYKAMGLMEANYPAVSVVSASANPETMTWMKENREKITRLILAFDDDRAGHCGTKKWISYCKENEIDYAVCFPVKGDWDDLWKEGKLNDDTIAEGFFRGSIWETSDPGEAAEILADKFGRCPAVFEHKGKTYKPRYKKVKGEDGPEFVLSGAKELIAGTVRNLYSRFEFVNGNSREYKNRFIVRTGEYNIPGNSFIVEGKHLSSSSQFDQLLCGFARMKYKGDTDTLHEIVEKLVRLRSTRAVEYYDTYGYHPDSEAYIFHKYAIDRNGKLIEASEHGYFDELNIAPMEQKDDSLHVKKIQEICTKSLFGHIARAFRESGLLQFGYNVATLFSSSTIYPYFNCFPFYSSYGPIGSGKSKQAKFFNGCFCLYDSEGFNLAAESTKKGFLRLFASYNSLPITLIEGNRGQKISLNENAMLSWYDRNQSQLRANNSNDKSTNTLPFNAGIQCIQNNEFMTLGALKQRFISVETTDWGKIGFGDQQKKSYDILMGTPCSERAWVGVSILKDRKFYEENLIKIINKISDTLHAEGITNERIKNNYAIMLGGLSCFLERNFSKASSEHVYRPAFKAALKSAQKKMQSCENEIQNVDNFISIFSDCSAIPKTPMDGGNYLREGHEYIITDDNLIHIRLTWVLKLLNQWGYQNVLNSRELGEEFRRHPSFVSAGDKRSQIWKESPKYKGVYTLKKEFFDLKRDVRLRAIS